MQTQHSFADVSPPTPPPEACNPSRVSRLLGDSEASYFLPSRADGVNDMYLHLGFTLRGELDHERVRLVWAILCARHPLLAARVEMEAGDYTSARFVHEPVPTGVAALTRADRAVSFTAGTQHDLIDGYLNGPRTLSNDRLARLVISRRVTTPLTPPATPSITRPDTPVDWTSESSDSEVTESSATSLEEEAERDYDFMLCAVHFIGDGMALHACAAEFFGLLLSPTDGAESRPLSIPALRAILDAAVCAGAPPPPAMEGLLQAPSGRFADVAARVDFANSQRKLIGAHTFPAAKERAPRHTVVRNVSFSPETTKAVLRACKREGVSLGGAMFALCAQAWDAPVEKRAMPLMMYSALNMRPHLRKSDAASYWFLAVGYFNVVLPAFGSFWHRARHAKKQAAQAAGSKLLAHRARVMATERGIRARTWAAIDDAPPAAPTPTPVEKVSVPTPPTVPSQALVGLSLLGNLDATYQHAAYPGMKLHTLTTGSRQRRGGMLIFAYTFAGRLWLSLGYDVNAFDAEIVEQFWGRVIGGVTKDIV